MISRMASLVASPPASTSACHMASLVACCLACHLASLMASRPDCRMACLLASRPASLVDCRRAPSVPTAHCPSSLPRADIPNRSIRRRRGRGRIAVLSVPNAAFPSLLDRL